MGNEHSNIKWLTNKSQDYLTNDISEYLDPNFSMTLWVDFTVIIREIHFGIGDADDKIIII